ncbi:exonuclease [Pectobacterium phage POP12]|nr:exonuclease [Pectobacterium phage POP12]
MATDYVFDWETVGPAPKGIVVELSYTPFIDQPDNVPSFLELVSRSRKYKFDIKAQKGTRISDAGTIGWWKKQAPEAQAILKPLPDDLTISDGIGRFLTDLKADGIVFKESLEYCRGPEFDRSILVDVMRQIKGENDVFDMLPVPFWNCRDIRTAIENRLLTRGLVNTPLPLGTLEGFIKHNSIHDCAKDVLMLIYALRYAYGIEQAPTGENVDPLSIQIR